MYPASVVGVVRLNFGTMCADSYDGSIPIPGRPYYNWRLVSTIANVWVLRRWRRCPISISSMPYVQLLSNEVSGSHEDEVWPCRLSFIYVFVSGIVGIVPYHELKRIRCRSWVSGQMSDPLSFRIRFLSHCWCTETQAILMHAGCMEKQTLVGKLDGGFIVVILGSPTGDFRYVLSSFTNSELQVTVGRLRNMLVYLPTPSREHFAKRI